MISTRIEWASKTWNPITGCPRPKISPGCEHCYAERMAKRLAGRFGYDAVDPFKITFHPERLKEPVGLKVPQRIFVGSMGDMFHPGVLYRDLDLVLAVAALTPQHTYMFLTKRPAMMLEYMTGERKNGDEGITSGAVYDAAFSDRQWRYFAEVPSWKTIRPEWSWKWPLPNVWLGVTVCTHDELHKIQTLLDVPAVRHFVSLEPLLENIDLDPYTHLLDWVICGGETGHNARPMHPSWVKSLRDQCQNVGIPFFFKDWGEYFLAPGDEPHFVRFAPGGKRTFGRLLDGKEWNEVPV